MTALLATGPGGGDRGVGGVVAGGGDRRVEGGVVETKPGSSRRRVSMAAAVIFRSNNTANI